MTEDAKRVDSADGSLSIEGDGAVRAEHLPTDREAPVSTTEFALLPVDIVCPVHHIPDCGALLNGCSLPSVIGARIRTAVGRARAADAFKRPEPHAYAVEVLHNIDRPSERWALDDEVEPGERADAEAGMEEAIEAGHHPDTVRLVAIMVVES